MIRQYLIGAKKEMLPFPFQVVQIVRYSSQGPSNAPGTLVGALSGLIPAPEGTFYSAAASMVLRQGSSKWEDALMRHVANDWSVPLQYNTRVGPVQPMSSSGGKYGGRVNEFDVEESGLSAFGSTAEEESLINYGKNKSASLSVAQLKLKANARLDPKTYWAAERTLLAWVHVAIFLCISSAQLLSFGNRNAQLAGAAMAPCTIVVAIYSLVRFHFRNVAILNSNQPDHKTMFSVVDLWGPWITVPLICGMMVMLCVLYFLFE